MWALGLALALVVPTQSDYDLAMREARALMEEGRRDEAVSRIEGLVASHPDRLEAYLVLGALHRQGWRPSDALEAFTSALEATNVADAELEREIAVTYAELRLWDRALEHVEASLARAPDNPATLMTKAMILTQRDERSEALALYERVAAANPQNADVHFRIGELQESVQRLEDAEASFRQAIALDPGLRGARVRLGKLLLASGEYRPAERQLTRALALAPGDPVTHLELARALDGMKRVVKARHHFERALELDPRLTEAYLAYGNFAVQNGDAARGRELLETFQELTAVEQRTSDLFGAVEYAPDDAATQDELVAYLLETEQYPLAVRTVQRLLLQGEPSERLFVLLARSYAAWGQPGEAERTLVRALALYPDSAALRSELGSTTP